MIQCTFCEKVFLSLEAAAGHERTFHSKRLEELMASRATTAPNNAMADKLAAYKARMHEPAPSDPGMKPGGIRERAVRGR